MFYLNGANDCWPRVFIVVLNWNAWLDTLECLESLQEIDYPNYEIIIVDNGSTDKSVEQIKNYILQVDKQSQTSRGRCTLITNDTNLGFAGGNNIGIKYSREKLGFRREHGASVGYVLLLNNDTVVGKDFLKRLIWAGKNDKAIGLLGPKIYFHNDPNRIFFAGGRLNKLLTRGTHKGYGESELSRDITNKESMRSLDYEEVDYVTGCCLLIKGEVIEKIGLLPEEYFLYYEDVEWNLKAQKAGYKTVLVPEARIWHKVSQSTKEGSFLYLYYLFRNGLLLARRNGHSFVLLLAYIQSIYILAKQLFKVFVLRRKGVWEEAVSSGIIDFYRNRFGEFRKKGLRYS
ncbi:glycosyltransferase family 2 protein [Candidatus Bathyarchaeota archaeon]|nr:glycosyltransferase family 2 protein [Candidatus Bathyarchaeota archaeon]